MKVKLEFLYETAREPIEADVKELSIEFMRVRETGAIFDIGVKLVDVNLYVATHFGIHKLTLILEEAKKTEL